MAVNLDWGLARPQQNALSAGIDGYLGGQQIGMQRERQNALMQQNAVEEQRAATQFSQGQEDRSRAQSAAARAEQFETLKMAGQLLQGVETPEQWEAARGNPQLAALIPDIAGAQFEQVQQLRQIGLQLNRPELQIVGGEGTGWHAVDKRTGTARQVVAPAPRQITVGEGQTVYEIPRDGGSSAPAVGGDWLSDVAAAAPDAQVTSGYRSPADNSRVGGVPNSRHLTGEAADLVPRPGETMAQLAARVGRVPGVRAINEGDHVHVQTTGARSAGPRVVAQGALKQREQWVQLPDGRQRNTLTGKIEGSADNDGSGKAPTEAQTRAVSFAYRTQQANKRMTELVDRGLVKPRTATAQLFESDKNGVVRIVTKTNEDRQFMQAAKEWLAPVLRKDTGAAVTDGELATYMDIYIPRFEDDPTTIRQKAAARKDAMIALVGETGGRYEKQYGKPSFNVSFVPPKATRPTRPAPPKVGEVRDGYRFKGGNAASPSSWVKVR